MFGLTITLAATPIAFFNPEERSPPGNKFAARAAANLASSPVGNFPNKSLIPDSQALIPAPTAPVKLLPCCISPRVVAPDAPSSVLS